jgi:hypothetical protein
MTRMGSEESKQQWSLECMELKTWWVCRCGTRVLRFQARRRCKKSHVVDLASHDCGSMDASRLPQSWLCTALKDVAVFQYPPTQQQRHRNHLGIPDFRNWRREGVADG